MSILCALPMSSSRPGEGSPLLSATELWPLTHLWRPTAAVHYFDLGATPSPEPASPPASPLPILAPAPSLPPKALAAHVEAYRTLAQHGYAVSDTHAPYDEDDIELAQSLHTATATTTITTPIAVNASTTTTTTTNIRVSTAVTATASPGSAPLHAAGSMVERPPKNTVPSAQLLSAASPRPAAPRKAPEAAEECANEPQPHPPSTETTPCASPTRPCLRTAASPAASTADSGAGSPLSPTRKRISWADVDGCGDLVAAMPFMRDDEPWRCARGGRRVPALLASAYLPLRLPASALEPLAEPCGPRPVVALDASLPAHDRDVMTQLGAQGVQLESVLVRAPLVFCTVRVLNVAFEKTVLLRVTKDNWATSMDVTASYMPGSSDGRSDRFYASLSVTDQEVQDGVQFAICYRTPDREFWDNNSGANYSFTLVPPS